MRILVVGFGSIGQRHARVLGELECQVAIVSRRSVEFPRIYASLRDAVVDWRPEYVIVASKTRDHHDDLMALASLGFNGRVLVEKPLFDVVHNVSKLAFSHAAVAYNLRAHPLLLQLRHFLASQSSVISAQIYVGQYLPQWRPTQDYREGYSSRRLEGGGVLRDLSHELDYALWLFGPWTRLTALGGHFSHLEIDSDDVFSVLMATERCPLVQLHMNYLDRVARREILVQTDDHSVRIDMIGGLFEVDGIAQPPVSLERDYTYRAEHRAMLAGDLSGLCSVAEGLDVVVTISAIENAANSNQWIIR